MLHPAHVFRKRNERFLSRRIEHQQILERFLVCSEAVVKSVFQLQSEVLEEADVFFTIGLEHGKQLALDLLFESLCYRSELSVMLQHFPGNVQRQIL